MPQQLWLGRGSVDFSRRQKHFELFFLLTRRYRHMHPLSTIQCLQLSLSTGNSHSLLASGPLWRLLDLSACRATAVACEIQSFVPVLRPNITRSLDPGKPQIVVPTPVRWQGSNISHAATGAGTSFCMVPEDLPK